jgi:preprotein translocase SecE subunit
MIDKIKSFLQESKQEFKRVNWPTTAETRRLTLVVIGLSVGTAIFLGLLDFLLTAVLQQII